MALSTDSELQVVDPLAPTVDPSAAGRLQLSDDRVFAVTFVRRHHGAVFCHTTVFLPPSTGARLEGADELSKPGAVNRVTVIGMLDDALPGRIQEADQSISVAPASSDVAAALGTSPSTALLRIDRTYFDTDALPVELAISHFLPERYSYRVRLRRALS
jgi:DNA-binding GntR family transcriptional regulator